MKSNIFTHRDCTIEVASGGRTATVKRNQTGESDQFTSLPGGPSAQVQAQRWAMGLPVSEAVLADVQAPIVAEAATEDTELDEMNDGE